MTEEKGIIEKTMDMNFEFPEKLISDSPAPLPPQYTYFVHYTCEVMNKRLEISKIFNFETPINGSTFDSISAAIAQHEKVTEIVITNFIRVISE